MGSNFTLSQGIFVGIAHLFYKLTPFDWSVRGWRCLVVLGWRFSSRLVSVIEMFFSHCQITEAVQWALGYWLPNITLFHTWPLYIARWHLYAWRWKIYLAGPRALSTWGGFRGAWGIMFLVPLRWTCVFLHKSLFVPYHPKFFDLLAESKLLSSRDWLSSK